MRDVKQIALRVLRDDKTTWKDGWIGPESVESGKRNFWGRVPFLLGLTQLVEADPTTRESVFPALRRFLLLAASMVADGGRGIVPVPGDTMPEGDYHWGQARAADLMIVVQWVYEHEDEDVHYDKYLDLLANLRRFMAKWEAWYDDALYPVGDPNKLPEDFAKTNFVFMHGVNVAQGMYGILDDSIHGIHGFCFSGHSCGHISLTDISEQV